MFDDLLYYKRNGNDELGLLLGKRGKKNLRSGHLTQITDAAAKQELKHELEGKAEHVSHWQYGYDCLFIIQWQDATGELHVYEQCPVRNHHALRVTCCAGGVVQDRKILTGILSFIFNAIRAEAIGIFLDETFFQISEGIVKSLGTAERARHIVHQDYAVYIGHLFRNYSGQDHIAGHEQFGLRVVHQCMHVRRFEIVQDGNRNRSVCQDTEERDAPGQTVLSAEGHLVTLADPCILKKQMYPGDSFGQFTVSYSLALKIRKGLVLPMTTETVLKHLDEADSVHVTIRSPVNDSFHLLNECILLCT